MTDQEKRDETDRDMERIEHAYQGVLDRINRASNEEERGYVLYLINSKWCTCGKDLGECLDGDTGAICGCSTPFQKVTAYQCPKCGWTKMDTVQPEPTL